MAGGSIWSQWKRLSFNQKVTLGFAASSVLLAGASLVVAVVAVLVAADTNDIERAIGTLSTLAQQTKRQADNSDTQIKALREQVGEAKAQTKAISAQTDAIRESSDANVKAATAQQRMADVTAKAQTPNVDLSELRFEGLTNQPDKDGWVPVKLFWRFRNTGGSAFTTKKVVYGLVLDKALPDQMPDGATFDGQDVVVTPTITSAFAPAEPIPLNIRVDARDDLKAGRRHLFFFAKFFYEDGLGQLHVKCFGRQAILNADGNFYFAVPAGGPAYRCST